MFYGIKGIKINNILVKKFTEKIEKIVNLLRAKNNKANIMGERNTAVLLQEWGVWLKQDSGFNLRARSAMQMIIQSTNDDGDYEIAQITDGDAMEVDRAMARLKLHRPEYFRVLWLACVCGYSFRATASSMNVGDKIVARLYEGAFAWIDFALNVDVYLNLHSVDENILHAA